MITRTEAEAGVLTQLQNTISALQLAGSIVHYLDRPDQFSADMLRVKHPKGLILVQYDESEAAGKTESILIAAVCLAFTPQKVIKLGDAVRHALNDFQIDGATRFELHDDKPVGAEAGIYIRSVRFRCNTPAIPPSDRIAAIAALNL